MSDLHNKTMPQRPVTSASAVDVLVQQIKTYIADNNLSIGDTLPSERELGDKFEAARNTVREAVGILKAYGVVDVRPKVGAVIVNRHMDAALNLFSFQLSISRETFLDIQAFRRLLEIGMVDELFDKANAEDLGELGRINTALLRADSAEDAALLDFEFHTALLTIIGNKTILMVFNTMRPIIAHLMETGKQTDGLQKTYEQHAQIIDALARKDRLGFRYHMSAHLDQGLKYIDASVGDRAM